MVAIYAGEGPEFRAFVVAAGQQITATTVNFMAKEARGLVCLALAPDRCDALGLRLIATRDADRTRPFTISIEARDGVTTGISAFDRAQTIRIASDPAARPEDLVRPGHILPLRTAPGGALESPHVAEAAVDLVRLAGLVPAAAVCAILDRHGDIASAEFVQSLAEEHGLGCVAASQVAEYRAAGLHRDALETQP
jgi:3,4-dihydroxy 2-butanone 4-phosphate synthase/GTP cyclohydrolase II